MRREGALTRITIADTRAAIATQLQRHAHINLMQFESQLLDTDVVKFWKSIMQDITLPMTLRLEASDRIANRAHGVPVAWRGDAAQINPADAGLVGQTVGDEIREVQRMAQLHRQLNDLVARRVRPDQWPEDVRAIAGEIIEAMTAEDV